MDDETGRWLIRIHAMLYEVLSILLTAVGLAVAGVVGWAVAKEYGNTAGWIAGMVLVLVLGYYGQKRLDRFL